MTEAIKEAIENVRYATQRIRDIQRRADRETDVVDIDVSDLGDIIATLQDAESYLDGTL